MIPGQDSRLPRYDWGQRVKALNDLRNDGSYPNAPANAVLVKCGDVGEVVQIGQVEDTQQPVYMVEFGESLVVGVYEEEIEPV